VAWRLRLRYRRAEITNLLCPTAYSSRQGQMIDPSNDRDLDALLGGGRLGGPDRDRIFDHIAAEVAREPRPRSRRKVWKVAIVAAGAAAGLVVLAVREPTRTAESVRAKGDQRPGVVQLGVACIEGTLEACPQGATLTFGASGASEAGVLSAYAELRERGAERIWYFSAESETPRLDVRGGTAVAQRAVRIGPEHIPGRYRVHVFLTRAPVSRALLLSGGPPDSIAIREIDLRVVAPADGAHDRR
jgi:hypothetical protein